MSDYDGHNARANDTGTARWTINSPEPPAKEQLRVAAAEAKASVAKAETTLNYARARLEFLQNICKPHEYLKGYCATCGCQERSNYHD